jgi:hypothetical protein
MELQVYTALTKVGIPSDDAQSAAESINKAIDARYALHSAQLATRGDLEAVRGELKAEIAQVRADIAKSHADTIKWCVGSIFAAVSLAVAFGRLFSQ